MLTNEILTPETFEKLVEQVVYDGFDEISYIDAVIKICEERGMEVESAAGILTADLKSKLQTNFMDINMIPKKGQLPIDW